MTPFPDLYSAMKFWMQECSRKDAPLGVVVDFRDIGKGLQRREIRRDSRRGWYIGFPDTMTVRDTLPPQSQQRISRKARRWKRYSTGDAL